MGLDPAPASLVGHSPFSLTSTARRARSSRRSPNDFRYGSSVVPASARLKLPSMNTIVFHSASVAYQFSACIDRPERCS